ncbi:alpha/beta hydrolase [Amycolatopsis sp. CA-230715]|uniref:alpha/beta hydrolase n=1 Tax=Amycolatopsis sp. CA-230715 TaxID=2745196 RepID=UPI001C330811|nr:alpha/beta hydrolase [Amycolatopsis sp. CA-230715]QWF82397.1 Tripeptidyl aminopeptidase [Amycolatopsis sp. CA-230715]
MRRLFLAAVGAATLASSVLAVPSATAAPAPQQAPPVATINWGPCTDPTLIAAGGECGFLDVPLDYDNPNGKKIQLAVGRVKHKVADAQYQGVMLTNPGGPGGSGLRLAARGAKLPNHAGDFYDWIGFDPRGVGTSKPALSCDPNYMDYNRPSYLPVTPKLEKTWLDRAKGYADACAKKNPELLDHIKTTDTVKDMDSIRASLGAEKMNFYGYSYGTYLGQVYGTMFPDRVRRMVLDSTVDPRNVWYQANLNQDVAFDVNLKVWFGWVAQHDDVYHLGKTQAAVKRVFDEQLLKLSFKPAGGVVGADEWTDVFQQASYYQVRWPVLGDAFAKFVNSGDWQTMKKLFEQFGGRGDDNGYAVYLAVQCSDVQWPQNWNQWRVDNWRTFLKGNYFTWQNAWYNAPCVFWHGKAGKPVNVNGSKVESVLMIDETLDAPTPYEGSLEARSRFPGARLIAEPGGTSHAVTPRGNTCVDSKIADYLTTGALPARKPGRTADVECAPLPQPEPTPPATAAAPSAAAKVAGAQPHYAALPMS